MRAGTGGRIQLAVKKCRQMLSPAMLSFLFMAICLVLIHVRYGVRYLSNDDTGIMKTFSGYSKGVPTPYHQYGSYTLGLFYKCLYTLIPTWNWYSYISILVLITSNAVIICTIYKQRASTDNKFRYFDFLIIGLLTVAITMYGMKGISWTINGALASIAGMLLLIGVPGEGKCRHLQYIFGGGMLLTGALTRGASYKAVMPFAILALCFRLLGRKAKRIWLESVALLVLIAGIGAYSRFDSLLKQGVFPSDSNSFEYYRGLFTDRPHLPFEGNEAFYESLGWDQEFYQATACWMFIDPRFNEENLKKIAEASRELREQLETAELVQSYWIDFMNRTKKNPVRMHMSIGIVLFLITGIVLAVYEFKHNRVWLKWLLMACAQILAIAECIYLLMRERIPDHVFYCAVFPALFIGIWVLAGHVSVLKNQKVLYLVLVILSVYLLSVSMMKHLSLEASERERQREQVSTDADKICFSNPENLYIYDSSIISGTGLFLNMEMRGCLRNALMWGGTGVFSRNYYEKIGRFGYREFYSSNLFDDRVYYITTDCDVWNSFFMVYMKKTYGNSVNAELIEKTDSGICIYKFLRE